MPKIKEVKRWEAEIELARKFREEEFGEYDKDKVVRCGENIDYYEKGMSTGVVNDESIATLNLFHALTKNVVPALYYRNPQISAQPRKKDEEESAPLAAQILNYFYKEIDADVENQKVVFDAYVLGKGYCKIGYCTKFGTDVPSDEEKKTLRQKVLDALNPLKKEEEEVRQTELDSRIVAESPYIQYVSPFNILIDPRCSSIETALWIDHFVEKTVESVRANKKYKNTDKIKGDDPDLDISVGKLPQSEIEAFRTVILHEIHYRQPDGYYLLVLAEEGDSGRYTELYHEKSIYEIDGWQFEELDFNLHQHKYYKASELTKIKALQDRFTSIIDNILAQVDSFVPKIGVDETALAGEQALRQLTDGDIGAIVKFNKNPQLAIHEIALTQYKADLAALNNEIMNLVTIQTGITRAQLTGMQSARSATEANIEQGGQTLRLSDMTEQLNRFAAKQARKLWQIIQQFVELEEMELITGESGVDPNTGLTKFSWMPDITSDMAEKLSKGEYRFEIAVGSTQKVDNALVTKRIENLISILARTDVIALMQQQGKKVDLAEILKLWLLNNPEVVRDTAKIIQDVGPMTQGLLPAQEMLMGGGAGGTTTGSAANQALAMSAEAPPEAQGAMQL